MVDEGVVGAGSGAAVFHGDVSDCFYGEDGKTIEYPMPSKPLRQRRPMNAARSPNEQAEEFHQRAKRWQPEAADARIKPAKRCDPNEAKSHRSST